MTRLEVFSEKGRVGMVFSVSRFGLGVLLCVGFIGCNGSPELQSKSGNVLSVLDMGAATKIREVQKNNVNQVVRLRGKIGSQAPLMGGQVAYELRDDTGSVWIVTQEKLPASGTQIGVQGQVRVKKMSIAGQEQTSVYIEQRGSVEILPASQGTDSKSS